MKKNLSRNKFGPKINVKTFKAITVILTIIQLAFTYST